MFNWFRRKFDDKDSSEEKKSPEPEQATQERAASTNRTQDQTKLETATTSPEDYLTWAKTAYQNIQQRKEQAPSPVETREPELEEKTTPTADTSAEKEIEAETTPTSDNVPAWMRKSDRLEKLKKTAIETPVEAEEVVTAKIETDALALDEDFVWSAKILADQGRTPDDISEEEISWLKRLRQGLGKTRRGLINQLKAVVGQGPLNQEAVIAIEALLLQADVGIEATDQIVNTLQEKLREEALPPEEAIAYLKQIIQDILDRPLQGQDNTIFVPEKDTLNIWLLTGVNGAGKTTTIGKLAHLAQKSGYSCLIAAADTFRAAAVEQVKVWGERAKTSVIANPDKNTDPAAVVFDAIAAAKARNTELLLVDTAGRLQNKKNLMDELAKIRRIIDKKAPHAKVESLLVLDATLGQNGLRQAQVFSEAAKLSGVVLTKLDGTAKGGVALAVTQQLELPIRFIGAGEGIEDLRPFSSYEFVEALLNG
ncbi:signal recognition particle-docking protein FtsY [Pleurocapsales cyanobacterium LEGE 06147]|nr:signal recognition particle-docking protein FtsY [Pleurocapsales cyanobacterium LEGE 06147]